VKAVYADEFSDENLQETQQLHYDNLNWNYAREDIVAEKGWIAHREIRDKIRRRT
jgi:hypothetical protein